MRKMIASIANPLLEHFVISGGIGLAIGWLTLRVLVAALPIKLLDSRWGNDTIGVVSFIVGLVIALSVLTWLEGVWPYHVPGF